MYLFTRRRRIDPGSFNEGIAFATETAAQVTQIVGSPINAWASVWGQDAGTVVWAGMFEDLVALEQAGDKLAVDAAFSEKVRSGNKFFTGGVEDGLAQIIHGEPTDAVNGYVSVVQASLAEGKLQSGIASAIEIADAASKLSGLPGLVTMATTGIYGGIAWITGFADAKAMQDAEAAVNGDAKFVALVDKSSSNYNPGASQAIYRRLS